MATRVFESAVVDANVDDVWKAIRALDFSFLASVQGSENEEKARDDEVGSVIKITYKDGTAQRLKRLELSDLHRFVTWEVIESTPAVTYLSQVSTITLKPITKDNKTYIEWVSDFSGDAGTAVIQDAKFKRLDAFADLQKKFTK
jgi:hypothetical protein